MRQPTVSYAVLRVKALKTWPSINAMSKHGQRMGTDNEHFDRSRVRMNRFGSTWSDPKDIRTCVEAVTQHHQARRRKGSPLASHLLLTASPAYFRSNSSDQEGKWDQERLEKWVQKNLEWVSQKWPDQVACWRLDLDETTPHLDFFLVPIHSYTTKTGKKVIEVSHRQAFGFNRHSFSQLQDEYAIAMEPLGLARGRPRTVTKAYHVNPAEYRRRLASAHNHQKALRIGIAGLLRGDISDLRLDKDGRLIAVFSTRVPLGARDRFVELMAPAANQLLTFEKRLAKATGKLVQDLASEVILDTKKREKDVLDMLTDLEFLRSKMSATGLNPPAEWAAQLELMRRQIIEY